MNLKDLKKPFPATDIEWRIGRCGIKNDKPWAMALAYITARAIHDRLDDVCSSENWQLRYIEHLGETICEIGVKFVQEWIWKAGGAGKTEFEAFKGGLSSAEKRAGVPWGIGRYLYKLPKTFVNCSTEKKGGWHYGTGKDKDKKPFTFYWETPLLPAWALPEGEEQKKIPEPEPPPKKKSEKKDPPKGLASDEQRKEIRDIATNYKMKDDIDFMNFMRFVSEKHPDYFIDGKINKIGAMWLRNEFGNVYDEYCVENKLA